LALKIRNVRNSAMLCTLCLALLFPLIAPSIIPSFPEGATPLTISSSEQILSESSPPPNSLIASTHRAPMAAPSPITNYTISAFLEAGSHTVNGETKIDYVNHADVSFSELYFHLYPNAFLPDGRIDVLDVICNSSPLDYTIMGDDDTVMEVDLVGGSGPGVLFPDEWVTLTISWQVLVPESQDRFGWYQRTEPFEFLGYNMGNWHPIVAVYDDRGWDTKPYSHMGESFYSEVAIYNVTITVPADYVVAATGELQAIHTGISTRDWHFVTGPVRDFTWCASPDYEMESILSYGVNVSSYFVADHITGGERVLDVAIDCLRIYGDLFGPYPWASLAIVEADIWAGGMEYPQLVMIGLPLYFNPDGLSSLAIVTAHEIGHEWIPFTMGTDSYSEPWIDEGFASFCEYAWVEYVYGATTRANYRQTDLDLYWEYVESEGDKIINQSMAYWQLSDWYAYGRIVYAKAALVYDMLRHQLTNQTFYLAWNYIYSEAIHQNLRAISLQHLFEDAVGESLDWFFDPWVYGSGVVTLGLGGYSIQPNLSGWQISVQIIQYQPTPVRLRVPIAVTYGAHSTEIWVWMEAQSISTHTIVVPEFPLQLILDPARLLLCQYQSDMALLSFAPGSPIPLAIGGVVGAAIVAGAVIIYRRRHHS
jgi:hypothetical protein